MKEVKKKSIFLEVIGVFFGMFMIVSGIYEEVNRNYFQMEGASPLLDIKPGFSSCLYGIILVFCCATLIYTKRFKK